MLDYAAKAVNLEVSWNYGVLPWLAEESVRYRETVEVTKKTDTIGDPRLHPYQRVGVEFLRVGERVLLADAPGLGKTVQALMALAYEKPKRTLIISTGAKWNWRREAAKWDFEPIEVADGERHMRYKLLRSHPPRVAINYHMLLTYPEILQTKWDIIIADEVHHLKNHQTNWTKKSYTLKSEQFWGLTGTPLMNNVDEIWSPLHLLDPHRFTSYWRFLDQYAILEENYAYGGKEVKGPKNVYWLNQLLAQYMLRRTKSEVLEQLPPMIPKTIDVELSDEHLALYRKVKKNLLAEIKEFGLLPSDNAATLAIRLRQAVSCPQVLGLPIKSAKTKVAVDLLEELIANGQKTIVFGYFRATCEDLRDLATAKNWPVYFTTGEVERRHRDPTIEAFKAHEGPAVLVGTIGALGEAWDIPQANNVIFMEKSWVPSDNEQAWQRAHRASTEHQIMVYSLVARKTTDVHQENVLAQKEGNITEVLFWHEMMRSLLEEG